MDIRHHKTQNHAHHERSLWEPDGSEYGLPPRDSGALEVSIDYTHFQQIVMKLWRGFFVHVIRLVR